ncbi:tail length tape measure protein [Providencia phage vB_PreS-PibeRecoleta]|uniref:Pre-tape measure frameshift protein n=2 Tax=Redjacvirus TaxID=2943015 RepID=A0A7G5B180_9CAUD|nr:tail length tape measure protein [Providencia phage vB_PreS-PibeRecoleta]YP_009999887.1 tail length tape measure protein [Providencia phage vB_PreS-Stilesk]QMV29980.1 pre-tape measure frameshift protein [Providencia phage vB_PreS-PibeRecoleta]QMV30053.1 pre-tape measure frameshift protein [Providencia phage vB_PreS-Stilesk]
MSLSQYTPDTETVIVKGRKEFAFEVRGLTFFDFSKIIKVHYHDLDGLFDLYEKHAGQDLTALATGRFATTLISDAPGIVAHIIALASDDGEAALPMAQSLPAIAQIDALRKIGSLTFSDVEEVKKAGRSGNGAAKRGEKPDTRTKKEIVLDFHNELRATVSFLLSEGHVSAMHYPLAYLWTESRIARRRINAQHVTQSLLMQSCIGAVLNGKKGGKEYQKLIKELSDG